MKQSYALLVRPGGLGDLLIALPSIALVREKNPKAHLTLACRPDYGRLFPEAGVVDDLEPVDSPRLAFLFGAGPPAGGSWADRFSAVFAWMRKAGVMDFPVPAAGTGQRAVIAPAIEPREPWSLFFLRRTLNFFEETRTADALLSRLGRFHFSSRLREEGLSAFGFGGGADRPIVVHTGSGGGRKRWPEGRFLEIMRRLSGEGRRGVCVTGEAEDGSAADLDDRATPRGWTRSRRPDILQLAGLMSGAGLFLGNDSGSAHLAAACGCPAVVLFLDEFALLWRPYGETHIVSAPSLEDIGTEQVWTELRGVLKMP